MLVILSQRYTITIRTAKERKNKLMKPSTYQISHKINHFVNQPNRSDIIITAAPFNRTQP